MKKRFLASGATDEEVLDWVNSHGTSKTSAEIEEFSNSFEQFRPYDDPDLRELFRKPMPSSAWIPKDPQRLDGPPVGQYSIFRSIRPSSCRAFLHHKSSLELKKRTHPFIQTKPLSATNRSMTRAVQPKSMAPYPSAVYGLKHSRMPPRLIISTVR
jgi:Domain of unknown function (DUF5069)